MFVLLFRDLILNTGKLSENNCESLMCCLFVTLLHMAYGISLWFSSTYLFTNYNSQHFARNSLVGKNFFCSADMIDDLNC